MPNTNEKKRQHKGQQNPIFMAEPMRASNSFVGTEEYIAPVCALLNLRFILFFMKRISGSIVVDAAFVYLNTDTFC